MKSRITINSIIVLALALIFSGCSHTNELAKYNLTSANVFFKTYVSPSLTKVCVDIHTGYGTDTKSLITVILGEVGSGYAESRVEEKLRNAVNADSLVENVMEGVEEGLVTYCKINVSEELDNNTRYVAETKLLGFRLASNAGGIYADAKTEVILTDRNTGKIIWDNTESSNIPLREVVIGVFGPPVVNTAASIINAVKLMNMTEDEIRAAVNAAADEAGRRQSETLREDISSKYD
jgi:hypothetical protein